MAVSKRKPSIGSIVKDPAEHFASPKAVVMDPRFTTAEKLKILESWALDAQLLSQAEAENMSGKDRPHLREVKLAMLELEKPEANQP